MAFETTHNTGVVSIAGGATRVDDDVDGRQLMLMMSKRFPDQPLEPVTSNCVADDAGGDRQSEPCARTVIGADKNGKESIGKTSRILVDAIEIRFVMKTLRRSKRPGGCLQAGVLTVATAPGWALDSQPLTALGTTAGQHQTSGAGGHARAETMSTCTMEVAGVVGALHAAVSCWICGRENCAKTSTWWAKKKGGKGTQRASGCQVNVS